MHQFLPLKKIIERLSLEAWDHQETKIPWIQKTVLAITQPWSAQGRAGTFHLGEKGGDCAVTGKRWSYALFYVICSGLVASASFRNIHSSRQSQLGHQKNWTVKNGAKAARFAPVESSISISHGAAVPASSSMRIWKFGTA